MYSLDSRQRLILEAMLAEDPPSSAAGIAARLDISPRIVRYNLPAIEKWLRKRDLIFLWQNGAISLTISPQQRQALLQELNELQVYNLTLTPAQRRERLLFALLTTDGPLTSHDLENVLGVSRPTLAKDYGDLEAELETDNLYIRRKPRLGAQLVGREDDRRRVLVGFILNTIGEQDLLNLCLNQPRSASFTISENDQFKLRVLGVIETWNLPRAWQAVFQIEQSLDCRFPDTDFLELALHWAIALYRCSRGHSLSLPRQQAAWLQHQPEYNAVDDVIRQIIVPYSPIYDDEIAGLALVLAGARRGVSLQTQKLTPLQPDQDQYLVLASQILREASIQLKTPLHDTEVAAKLADHLIRFIVRTLNGLQVRNPLLAEVRKSYPDLWKVTREATEPLALHIGQAIPDEELAYITMYLGMALSRMQTRRKPKQVLVVCPSGGVTSWMLVSRLHSEFPDLSIADVISLRDLEQRGVPDVDAIVSTAQLSNQPVPVITVSPLLRREDAEKIRTILNLMSSKDLSVARN